MATSGQLIGRAGLIQALGAMTKVLLLIGMLLASGEADACRCITGRTPSQEIAAHDRVFVGQVTSVDRSRSGDFIVSFKVSRSIKGPENRVSGVIVPKDVDSCGYMQPFFVTHKTYTVFADQVGTILETSRCSPNKIGQLPQSNIVALPDGT